MTMVATGLSTSVDGFIAGADDSSEQPSGIGGERLFNWLRDGDTPSRYYPSFKMSAVSAKFFDEAVGRVGRSEERRVGKECRYRWWAYHEKKKKEKGGGGYRGKKDKGEQRKGWQGDGKS